MTSMPTVPFRIDSYSGTCGAGVAAALSSLGGHLVQSSDASLVLVSGSDATWPSRAASASRDGARVVFVSRPVVAPYDELLEVSQEYGTHVLIAPPFIGQRDLEAAAQDLTAAAADAAIVESAVSAATSHALQPTLIQLLAEQVAVTRRLIGITAATCLARTATSYVVGGDCGRGTYVNLAGVLGGTNDRSLDLSIVAREERWSVRLKDPDLAARPEIRRHDSSGMCEVGASFESGVRSTLVLAWRQALGEHTAYYSVADYAQDLISASRLLG